MIARRRCRSVIAATPSSSAHGAAASIGELLPPAAKRPPSITQGYHRRSRSTSRCRWSASSSATASSTRRWPPSSSCAGGFATLGLTRNDVVIGARRRHGHRCRRLRRRQRGTAVCRWCTCPPRCWAWSTPRSAARPVSNLPEGKNLVGAFWQPAGVVCDLDALATLPDREVRCGRGEMAKYHFLTGDDLLAMSDADRIARCVADQGRGGRRRRARGRSSGPAELRPHAGHALEVATGHRARATAKRWPSAWSTRRTWPVCSVGSTTRASQQHHDVVAGAYGLETQLPAGVDHDRLLELMTPRQEGARSG